MQGTVDVTYGLARLSLLKSIVVDWIRAGGITNPGNVQANRIHRIFKHAEVQLLAFFGGHKEEARLGGPIREYSKRGQRPCPGNRKTNQSKQSIWGVRP